MRQKRWFWDEKKMIDPLPDSKETLNQHCSTLIQCPFAIWVWAWKITLRYWKSHEKVKICSNPVLVIFVVQLVRLLKWESEYFTVNPIFNSSFFFFSTLLSKLCNKSSIGGRFQVSPVSFHEPREKSSSNVSNFNHKLLFFFFLPLPRFDP